MKYIAFDSADDLLKFILSRRAADGRVPAFGKSVCFGKTDYRLKFEIGEWDESGDRFGGKIVPTHEELPCLDLSRFLEHILLQRVSSQFNSGASSIVLAVPVGLAGAAAVQQILYDAWRQVERVEWARSAFHSCKSPGGGGWQAVQIDGIAPGFDLEKFRQANRGKFTNPNDRMRVFAPAQNSGGCSLFVEWEYRYPRAVEFSQLHRDASSPLVLCTAEREAETRDGKRSWWVPGWHVFGAANYVSVSDLIQVLPLENVQNVRYEPDESGLQQVQLPLEIRPFSESMASARELESRIGALKRELEILAGKHERFERAGFQEYFPIYCWRQEAGQDALPAGLEHMLGRPLSELARYMYVRTPDESGATLHYVAGKDHQAAGLAAAVACDELYLCETRWLEWRLPLFVRQGTALSIDINEEEVAAKIRDVLPQEPGLNQTGIARECFCLVQPSGENGWPSFTWLTFSMTLDQAVAVTNGHAAGPPAAVRAAGFEAGAAALSEDVAISIVAQQLDATARSRTEEQLREVGNGWETARQNLQAAAFQVRLAELAMRPMVAARDTLPETWTQFVQRTIEADATAAKFKIEALGEWASSEPARKEMLLQHEKGLTDTAATIKLRRDEYEAMLPRIEARNKMLVEECEQLDKKLQEVRKADERLVQRTKELGSANAGLERQNAALEENLRTIQKEIDRHHELRQKLADCCSRMEDRKRALAEERAQVHQELDLAHQEEAQLTKGAKVLAHASADLERQIAAIEEKVRASELRIRTHATLRQKAEACQLNQTKAEHSLEESQEALKTALAELRERLEKAREIEAGLAAELSVREEAAPVPSEPAPVEPGPREAPTRRFWPFSGGRRNS